MVESLGAACEPLVRRGSLLLAALSLTNCFTYCNDDFIAASGYRRDELVGRRLELLAHPGMPAEVLRDMWATVEAGSVWSAVLLQRSRDGRAYWAQTMAAPVVETRHCTGYVVVQTCPRRADRLAAERLYLAMRSGAATWRKAVEQASGRCATSVAMRLMSEQPC